MEIKTAQEEVRSVFAGGAVGQTVSGMLWLLSAALGTWSSPRLGILVLAVGGIFIFPLTQVALRLGGGPTTLRRENPFNQLAMLVAFTIPLNLPVIAAAMLYNINWFYPAFLVVVGTHYLPFVFLYGMWQYAVLAGILIAGGIATGMLLGNSFSAGGWLGAAALLLFALLIALQRRTN